MKLRLLSSLALIIALAAFTAVPAASAQTISPASGTSVSPASGSDPFYIVDDYGRGYQIAGTGSDAPVLTVSSGNRYSFQHGLSVKGVTWYEFENGDGNCLDATSVGANVVYGESCVAGDNAQLFRVTLDSAGYQVIENKLYSKYLTATSIASGALVYLAGSSPSDDNIWALVST
jgi:hypothetical protein